MEVTLKLLEVSGSGSGDKLTVKPQNEGTVSLHLTGPDRRVLVNGRELLETLQFLLRDKQ